MILRCTQQQNYGCCSQKVLCMIIIQTDDSNLLLKSGEQKMGDFLSPLLTLFSVPLLGEDIAFILAVRCCIVWKLEW